MLYNLRLEIAAKILERASSLIKTSDFNNVMKGLKLVKLAVRVTPPGPEFDAFGDGLIEIIEQYRNNNKES